MPTLQVRNFPEHIYRKIAELAKAKRSSITKETIYLLEKSLAMDEQRELSKNLLVEGMLRSAPEDSEKLTDPVLLVREDRDR